MKQIFAGVLCLATLCICLFTTGCSSAKIAPSASQLKEICELATLECYYHNIAKANENDAQKFLFWSKDKHFWIEYDAVVKFGIDVSELTIDISRRKIKIGLPQAKMLSYKVDSEELTQDSFFVDVDSVKIKAEDEVEAFNTAKKDLEQKVSNDQTLISEATQRAQYLLENYINSITELSGKKYAIEWVYLDSEGNPIKQ